MDMDFTILNWNIGGAKYLAEKEEKRKETKRKINKELQALIEKYNRPYVITLQEIVRYKKSSSTTEDLIDLISKPDGYRYFPFTLIDSKRLSANAKWNKVRREGYWDEDAYFAQGNAILFRDDVPHFSVSDLSASSTNRSMDERHFIEQVNFESGLYFGDRDTEPRAALVAHFIYNPFKKKEKPLDIFVVNLHLTTLTMEREGIPEIDLRASRIRSVQLDIIFHGIVSRYNIWKQQDFPERGERRKPKPWETFNRYEPVWILAGDFNFTPDSVEYENIKRMNFIDVVPNKESEKGSGTKAKGAGNPPTLTVDYIFAGPKFISLDPLITQEGIVNNNVDHEVKSSDHYPMYAKIPLTFPKK